MGLSVDEFNLVEQPRTAYLSDVMQKEMRIQEIVEEVSSGEEPEGNDGDEELDENKLLAKLKLIKDKGKKRAKDEIEMRGLNGKRKSSKSAQSVLSRHPDIGEVMEQIVREADVGADKWRRTGVYTFTGDTKTEKRMTFKRLQERLSSHYGEKFSYGTVLHLCVHRNKRRISSRRYKGVANIKYQRARKGFNLKFNPDAKWSRSLYKCLDKLQIDGKQMLLLNRDDQAGFRLDSTFTHNNTPSLNVSGPTLTTHTDFLNKHQTQLQTTSYNFTKTTTTSEVCIGVVKASGLHKKNPAQHAADLDMLQNLEALKPVFFQDSGKVKDIECIRVDGASDEGPSHAEVQFLWTERHLNLPTKITLVTTRSSGDSFLNRVELQNGCLSRGHANLFIPSTVCGEPYDEEGQFDEAKHHANMEAALNQYIERVDGTPCMGTTIKLYRGSSGHDFLDRRSRLLVFLKGGVREKEKLKRENPQEYKYFERVWKVRQDHLDHNLPSNYIFLLRCCGKENCAHPLCQANSQCHDTPEPRRVNPVSSKDSSKGLFCICRQPESRFMICCDQCGEWFHGDCIGITEAEGDRMDKDDISFICNQCQQTCNHQSETELLPKWHVNGPSFRFFPYPVIDVNKPWGSPCDSCGDHCTGHFVTDIDRLLELQSKKRAIRALPPSVLIEEAFKQGCAEGENTLHLAKKCCLSVEEVQMWLTHLKKKKLTRARAVQKARETREKKKNHPPT